MEFTKLKQKVKAISVLNKIKRNEIYLKTEELHKQNTIEKNSLDLLKNIEATLSSFKEHENLAGFNTMEDRYMFSRNYHQVLTEKYTNQVEKFESDEMLSSALRREAENLYNTNKNICKKLKSEQINLVKYKDLYNAKI